MKSLFTMFVAVLIVAACSQGNKEKSAKTDKKPGDAKYLLSKEGIGDLKIGMPQKDIEKLLGQPLIMKHANDTGVVWVDTATAKYGEIEVDLYFQKVYTEEPSNEMELFGLSTSSPKCKTADGLGVGDDRDDVLAAYPDNPINMGPESVMVNDTTWTLSKTNYYININDDKWDKQIVFLLVNKKVATMQVTLAIGE